MDILLQELKILRNPSSTTPYNQGLTNAKALFDLVPDPEKTKILLFITDGYPDDQDPQATLELAQSLKDQGIKIITLLVTGISSQNSLTPALQLQKQNIIGYIRESSDYQIAAHYNSDLDRFFLDLLGDGTEQNPGLLVKISSSPTIFVTQSEEIPEIAGGLVTAEALMCDQ